MHVCSFFLPGPGERNDLRPRLLAPFSMNGLVGARRGHLSFTSGRIVKASSSWGSGMPHGKNVDGVIGFRLHRKMAPKATGGPGGVAVQEPSQAKGIAQAFRCKLLSVQPTRSN